MMQEEREAEAKSRRDGDGCCSLFQELGEQTQMHIALLQAAISWGREREGDQLLRCLFW